MTEKAILVDKIKRWLESESKIAALQREIKELRKNKKQLSTDLTDIMKNKQ
jgi:hypothetical protein